jgi:NADPH:quinone reductase-like Zn-dependent oxidoreductase
VRFYRPARPGDMGSLTAYEQEIPRPQRGEVLVRVRAVSLNYRDLLLLKGGYPVDGPDGLVPVSDAAGEVVGLGEGVRRFAVGDRVVNTFHSDWIGGPYPGAAALVGYGNGQDGWLTEYRVVSEQAVVAIPDTLAYEDAATLPCAAVTAWTALGGPRPVTGADTVLVQGTGGVSLFTLQLARLLGARVIATTSSAAKAERLTALGADGVVNYVEHPEWGKRLLEMTEGRGVDRVVEVGGPGTFGQSLLACGTHGAEIALVGFLGSGGTDVAFMDLFRSGVTLRKINVGSRQDTEDLLALLSRHPLKPVIDSVFPFERALDALRHFESRSNLGKVVITL